MEKNRPKVQTNVRQTVVASARITKSQPAPQTNTASTRSTSSKTQTIAVSKMTKLILKPSPLPKNPSAGKVTIKKYITKPVTANKSRSTLVSHQTTFRVQNILKTATNQQHTAQASNVDAIDSDNVIQIESTENERQPSQQPLAVEHNESGKNLLNSNTFEIPILQEITSTINNCLAVTNRSESDLGNSKSPRKSSKEPNENIQKCQLKSYDPIEARQFIRTQKEKRKEAAQDKSNAPLSKEEIKRRLSALHKNTLQIVSKNVKRARENSTDRGSTTKTAHVEKKIRPDTPRKGFLFSLFWADFCTYHLFYVNLMNFQKHQNSPNQHHQINQYQWINHTRLISFNQSHHQNSFHRLNRVRIASEYFVEQKSFHRRLVYRHFHYKAHSLSQIQTNIWKNHFQAH